MDYLQGMRPSFLDPSVDVTAVMTGSGLSALLIDLLADLRPP